MSRAGPRGIAAALFPALLAAGLVAGLSGCSASASADAPAGGPAAELRLGYFDNVTHAPALVGLEKGFLQDSLGDTELTAQAFAAGPAVIEALSAGAIDAAYVGPNPAVNTFVQSAGASARVVAGAASGGAALVVRPGIDTPADLAGTTLATPQLGNTQDVALRAWLGTEGFETDTTGGGDVRITPTENAQTLALFQSGEIDGAWLPEPWVSRLVIEAGAEVLVDEASLWPEGAFPTTVLLVGSDFLRDHPDTVRALLAGHTASVAWLDGHADEAGAVINARLAADTGKPLPGAVIERALGAVRFTTDPLAGTFPTLLRAGVDAGTAKQGNLDGLFDLSLLNAVLAESGADPVSAAGLGAE
ncbi:NitT/TauT family transport system substrate-binding protein [Cryobacterium psychrotolerans]|uniref:NitT/TauT family transport system substrate-binding protein n=1 Tax=Cryobacterium psychrotolerans TaxID=386301 RepID=A0A1G9DTJ7_9MICO|nr:ABC transporter substrate-binding protein [Cryobacterium sp. TMT1-2-1]TFD83402.1 ABC transporter substrate-binding protein [Cryobacterium psychrotolerans]SDK67145.1 NitT/TauT family transport system substrate-binding protein [Cryobacterium psychrotolerans]